MAKTKGRDQSKRNMTATETTESSMILMRYVLLQKGLQAEVLSHAAQTTVERYKSIRIIIRVQFPPSLTLVLSSALSCWLSKFSH